MPFYEYRCSDCGHEFEAMQKISDQPLSDCPECDDGELVKVISAVGFQLKGTGWYATDFKDKKKTGTKSEAKDKSDGHSCATGSCPACG